MSYCSYLIGLIKWHDSSFQYSAEVSIVCDIFLPQFGCEKIF